MMGALGLQEVHLFFPHKEKQMEVLGVPNHSWFWWRWRREAGGHLDPSGSSWECGHLSLAKDQGAQSLRAMGLRPV